MKKIFILLTFIISYSAYASHGIVIVHQAPLLNAPDFDEGRVVQVLRRGEKIFLHPKHIPPSPYAKDLKDGALYGMAVDGPDQEGFFQTIDQTGTKAYIEKRYVKIIYNDSREYQTSVRPFEHDHTDYRIEEPLPEDYPFISEIQNRVVVNMLIGPSPKETYDYSKDVIDTDFGTKWGVSISNLSKAPLDPYDRFYFGTSFFTTLERDNVFFNDGESREFKFEIGIGPVVSYDYFRSENYTLTIGGGMSLNYQQAIISLDRQSSSQTRRFSSFSITPHLKTKLFRKTTIPSTQFFIGLRANFLYSHRLKSSDSIKQDLGWNENADFLKRNTGGNMLVNLGIQISY